MHPHVETRVAYENLGKMVGRERWENKVSFPIALEFPKSRSSLNAESYPVALVVPNLQVAQQISHPRPWQSGGRQLTVAPPVSRDSLTPREHLQMNRRDMLRAAGATALALSSFPLGRLRADDNAKGKLLVFTRSQGCEHPVVKLGEDGTCLVDRIFKKLGAEHNFDVHCTKDGRIFLPETLKEFDAIFFETTEDLTKEGGDKQPPMPAEGKKALLDFVAAGKGFVGSHCASDTFHSAERGFKNQETEKQDPYIRMLGGEFIRHGEQQKAWMRLADPKFPGCEGLKDFQLHEEWYSLKNFAPDLHVILAQDNEGMKGLDYQRPNFPATWARKHEKGRVFYTSMGHREDVWESKLFQELLLGALTWAFGTVEADLTPNLEKAAPQASVLPNPPPPKKK